MFERSKRTVNVLERLFVQCDSFKIFQQLQKRIKYVPYSIN